MGVPREVEGSLVVASLVEEVVGVASLVVASRRMGEVEGAEGSGMAAAEEEVVGAEGAFLGMG